MEYAGKKFKNSEAFIFYIATAQKETMFLHYIENEALKSRKDLADIVMKNNMYSLIHFNKEIFNDFHYTMQFISLINAFDFLSNKIKTNKDIFVAAFNVNGLHFLYFLQNHAKDGHLFLDNEYLMQEVIAINTSAIEYASERIQNNHKRLQYTETKN